MLPITVLRPHYMSNFDADGSAENEWDEQGDLAWNEFDWERYLQQQDEALKTYLSHYEKLKNHPDRIDEVAHLMGWDQDSWTGDDSDESRYEVPKAEDEIGDYDLDRYTFHKNPIFVSTKALYLSLKISWEKLASDAHRAPQPLGLAFLMSLQRGEEHALFAIQALDMGDYALGVSLFKRSLREINQTFALIDTKAASHSSALAMYREFALPRLFDLREIWLRVMNECREELERNLDDEN